MRKFRKPLPSDYTGLKKSGRPTHYWADQDMQNREPTLLELVEAMARPGCPICFLAARSVRRYLEAYCHESVTDVPVRDRLRAAHGFCTRHSHQFLDERDALALAITYADVIKKLVAGLDTAKPGLVARLPNPFRLKLSSLRRGRARALMPLASCPACSEQAQSERRYAAALVEHLAEPLLRQGLEAHGGLCMVHLPAALELAGPQALEVLRAIHRAGLLRLRDHLGEIIRKADYRFAQEGITPEESRALLDAINRIAGEREIR